MSCAFKSWVRLSPHYQSRVPTLLSGALGPVSTKAIFVCVRVGLHFKSFLHFKPSKPWRQNDRKGESQGEVSLLIFPTCANSHSLRPFCINAKHWITRLHSQARSLSDITLAHSHVQHEKFFKNPNKTVQADNFSARGRLDCFESCDDLTSHELWCGNLGCGAWSCHDTVGREYCQWWFVRWWRTTGRFLGRQKGGLACGEG